MNGKINSKGSKMTKIILVTALLGSVLFANVATKAIKHEVKHETKNIKHDVKKKTDLNVDKKIKKEKRKMKVKAVKAVL